MAADGQVNVDIKISADTKGGEQTVQTVDKVEKKAKQTFRSMVGGIEDAKRAVGLLNKSLSALASFGFISAGFNSLIGIFDKFISSEQKAKEEAIKLAKAEKDAADKKRIDDLAESYKRLTASIADAAKERERENELADMQRSADDKLEDDTAELEMREKIAALDTSDPLYDKKKEKISSEYETAKLRRSVSRQRRDARIAQERTLEEMASTVTESTDKRIALVDERAELERLRREADAKKAESVSENAFDAHTVGQRFVQNLKSILTLDGSRFWNDRTEKGDEYREKAAEEAEAIEERIRAKEKEIAAREKEIANLDKTSSYLARKSRIQGEIETNAGLAVESAAVQSDTTNSAASKALLDEERKYGDAKRAKDLLTQQKAEIKEKIRAEQDRKAAAGRAVFQAQGEFDSAGYNGNRRDQKAAYDRLQEAKESALNVERAADSAINALNETLRRVESRLKAAQSFLDNQSKQQRNAWSESPAGA